MLRRVARDLADARAVLSSLPSPELFPGVGQTLELLAAAGRDVAACVSARRPGPAPLPARSAPLVSGPRPALRSCPTEPGNGHGPESHPPGFALRPEGRGPESAGRGREARVSTAFADLLPRSSSSWPGQAPGAGPRGGPGGVPRLAEL